jgi:hypothetical protein
MLPAHLDHLFWEYDVEKLRWPSDRNLVIAKILERGTWDDIRWLRSAVSDEVLYRWLLRSRGRGLSPPQMRYWQLILNLPPDEVERWLSDPSRRIWHGRVRRAAASRRAH